MSSNFKVILLGLTGFFFSFSPLLGSVPTVEQWKQAPLKINGIDAVDFFENRRKDVGCRQRYDHLRVEYKKALGTFEKAQKDFKAGALSKNELLLAERKFNATVDSFYQVMDLPDEGTRLKLAEREDNPVSFREASQFFSFEDEGLPPFFTGLADRCGDCTVPDVHIEEASNGHWYTSHGYCSVNLPADERKAAFEKAMAVLLTPHLYPQIFRQVMDFVPFEGRNYLANFGTAQVGKDFDGFMAVLGPKVFGMQTAYGYFIRNSSDKKVKDGMPIFDYSFKVTNNNGLRPPDVFEVKVTGEKKEIKPSILNNTIGWWQLDASTGIVRYSMAAELGIGLESFLPAARRVHLDTLSSLLHEVLLQKEREEK